MPAAASSSSLSQKKSSKKNRLSKSRTVKLPPSYSKMLTPPLSPPPPYSKLQNLPYIITPPPPYSGDDVVDTVPDAMPDTNSLLSLNDVEDMKIRAL